MPLAVLVVDRHPPVQQRGHARRIKRLVQLDPTGFEPWLNLGIARLGRGEIAEATEALNRAQSIRPDVIGPDGYGLSVPGPGTYIIRMRWSPTTARS